MPCKAVKHFGAIETIHQRPENGGKKDVYTSVIKTLYLYNSIKNFSMPPSSNFWKVIIPFVCSSPHDPPPMLNWGEHPQASCNFCRFSYNAMLTDDV